MCFPAYIIVYILFSHKPQLVSAIYGEDGARIQQIRQRSGAGITIDEALPGSTDHMINITGSEEQIQYAQFLLQQRYGYVATFIYKNIYKIFVKNRLKICISSHINTSEMLAKQS